MHLSMQTLLSGYLLRKFKVGWLLTRKGSIGIAQSSSSSSPLTEFQWLAEALGCLHQLVSVLLQDLSGMVPSYFSKETAISMYSSSFQDDFPLASLPLLGYSVLRPVEEDGIQKDFVFKLKFKNHVYFFRAESQYTFERSVSRKHGQGRGREEY